MRKAIHGVVTGKADTVIECIDGIEAVESCGRHYLDWFFMDIQMTKTDGIQAAIKILHDDASAKVVMVIDYDNGSFRSASRNAEGRGCVSKENPLQLTNFFHH